MSSHETRGILIDDGQVKSSLFHLLQLGAGCHHDLTNTQGINLLPIISPDIKKIIHLV